ncbi:MAG: FCD domain-containing protein [Actinobacteria bacterium]|nr:FCD domain-containing protein [Actinomycetota bacterium]
MSQTAPETERETVRRLVERTVFTPVRGAGAVAETVARLGEAIGLGLLRPGDRLPAEMQLASALGISAVSLRSALVVLRSAGLIETRRGRGGGTFITEGAAVDLLPAADAPTAGALEDLATERAVVEGGAAALAAERATPEQCALLESIVDGMLGMQPFEAWSERDALLHLVIGDASGSPRLVTRIAELRAEAYRISRFLPTTDAILAIADREHAEIVRAITAKKPARARSLMEAHVRGTARLQAGLGKITNDPRSS